MVELKVEKTHERYTIDDKEVSAPFTLVGISRFTRRDIIDVETKKIVGTIGFDDYSLYGVTTARPQVIIKAFNLDTDPNIRMFVILSPEYIVDQEDKFVIIRNPNNPNVLYRIPKGLMKDTYLAAFPSKLGPCIIKTTGKYHIVVAPKKAPNAPESEKKEVEKEEKKKEVRKMSEKEVKPEKMKLYGKEVNVIPKEAQVTAGAPSWVDELDEQVTTLDLVTLGKPIVINKFVKMHSTKYGNDFIIAHVTLPDGKEVKWITSASVLMDKIEKYEKYMPFACKVIKPKGKRYYTLSFDI
ncbi:MAG: hypothetical protein J7J44_02535 [Deltaproteobacteria bacterium]|nr:hypothetical protein [Deltaproteobacteria bacterium]